MASATKQPGGARNSKLTGARKAASSKAASGKVRSNKTASAKMASAEAAAHILQPAKGPRTVSHRKIKEAVDKLFRIRSDARG
jgi:hypothetical protein